MKLKAETLFFFGVVVVVLIAVGGLFLTKSQPTDKATIDSVVRDDDYSIGPKDAKVTLIEFADFQCPACKAAEPATQKLRDDYKDKVRFVFKQFPLPSHNNGLNAALASEAAGEQGKFWEFHSLLFEKQEEWSTLANPTTEFEKYAESLNLDVAKFSKAYKEKTYSDKINTDKSDGIGLGVSATPTFFLNGEKIEGGLSYDEFKQKIEALLEDNK